MTTQQLEKSWRAGKPDSIYLFYGEEEFLRSEMLQRAVDTFIPDASLRSFNYDQLFGNDFKINDVINHAKNYPVMAEMRVVICRDAEKLFKVRESEKSKRKDDDTFDLLYKYLEDPSRSTLLIFDMVKPGPKNQHPWKDLFAKTTPLEFPVLKESEAMEWITERASKSGRSLETKAATSLVTHLGTDLRTLASELEKLLAYTGDNENITAKDVEATVGVSPTYNIFELQKAIGSGNKGRAAEIAMRMLESDRSARYPMFAFLSKYLEQLAIAREMSAKRESDQSIAQAIGLFGGGAYFVKDYIAAARKYAPGKLDEALRALVRAEFDTRRVKIDDSLLVERLITEITP
ncbi:MAG: DNA polymerase III subunit delta [Bacteroidota bacterium]|nr:DNA polymerase III subunit delta [Bacteroidota bacterium]MDP4236125.1 DNA polymerase III subunit delta [Bacteroidota bacterium]